MAEMRMVMLTEAARKAGVHVSTFTYDNVTYSVHDGECRSVNQEVAAAWNTADTNTTTMAER